MIIYAQGWYTQKHFEEEIYLAEDAKPRYSNESRGYKTKGYSYKDRYIHDKECPECGGMSVYKDEWATQISYKCMSRSCRHNWFEAKIFPKKEEASRTPDGVELIIE